MVKVGITGGIAAGKTTVCKIFETFGVPVYYADERAIWLIENDADVISGIIDEFGPDAYRQGVYDRKYIAHIVFNQPDKLVRLNQIVHPAVGRDFQDWTVQQSAEIVIHEAALMIEAGLHRQMDKVVVVTAPMAVRIQRIVLRDQMTVANARKRIKAQMPQSEKVKFADYVIRNNERQLIVPQVHRVYNSLRRLV